MRSSAGCWASALLAASAFAQEPAASGDPLSLVLRRMAETPGVEAVFEERKEIALLAAPLETRGVIYFVPPDRFARFTTAPGPSALLIEGDEVVFREGERRQPVDLSGNRVAHAFVENFVALWSGDRERLERLYAPELRGTPQAWELRLVPRRPPLSTVLAAITLRGDAHAMQELVVEERDGDRTTTRFVRTRSERVFTPAELERIFRTGAPLEGVPAER